jgi:hypothetical protein
MQTARRLYVYLLTAISLGVLVAGLSMLLTVLFEQVGLGPSGAALFGGDEATRQQLTIASALTTVSLPVWLIHWFVAERGVRPGRPTADHERNSNIRGLYFALAMGALLAATAVALSSLLSTAVQAVAGTDVSYRNAAADLALLLVAGAAWAYHVALRSRDWGRGPISGAAAFLPRTYLYIATFVGLLMLLFGINGFIELIGRLALDEPPVFTGDESGPWWAFPLATAISQLVVGGAIWLGHTIYAWRLRADAGWRGMSERPARLRLAYFVAVIGASAIAVTYYLAEGVRNALAGLLSISDASGAGQLAGLIILPILSAIPFAAAWSLHQRQLRAEAATFDSTDRMRTADRLGLHAGALVGLVYAAVGVAWLLGLMIDVTLGASRVLTDGDVWQRQLAQFVPIALFGSALWLWNWTAIGTRYALNSSVEAAATSRRTALLLVLGGSVLAGIASLGLVLYRLFGTIFGIQLSGNVVSELSTPIGILIVAGAVAVYHGMVLRRDQELRGRSVTPAMPEVGTDAPAPVILRLLGPQGGDAEAALVALRERLPAGFALEVVPPASVG